MSRVFFAADLHYGHKNIHKYRPQFTSELEHRDYVTHQWNKTVTTRDKVYVLGDVCFTMEAIESIAELNGNKVLVRGNHDNLNTSEYLKVFSQVEGVARYKGFWLTHVPIHPLELRGANNIHGHVHGATIPDIRYENVSMENIDYTPIEWSVLIEKRTAKAELFYGRTQCKT